MKRRDLRTYLSDIRDAGTAIQEFVRGQTYQQYVSSPVTQAAVERKFAIVGEALNQAIRVDPRLATRIHDAPQIIAFRNRLVHTYSDIRSDVVWGVIERRLPALLAELELVMRELGE